MTTVTNTIAIILNWRDAVSTNACVDSLIDLDLPLGIVVVDNDSGDGSLERILAHCHARIGAGPFSLIEPEQISQQTADAQWICVSSSGRNGGYAYGNNFGIRWALTSPTCRYIWILNADTYVTAPSTLINLAHRMDAHPDIGICGAKVCYSEPPHFVQTLGGGTIDARGTTTQLGQGLPFSSAPDEGDVERRLSYVNGACAFVRREFIETVGLMNEDYFLYFEELDWAARRGPSFRLGYCADAVVFHHVGKSIGTADSSIRSPLSAYYMTSSRILFCRRHHRGALPSVIVHVVVGILRSFKRRHWRNAIAETCALFRIPAGLPRRLGVF